MREEHSKRANTLWWRRGIRGCDHHVKILEQPHRVSYVLVADALELFMSLSQVGHGCVYFGGETPAPGDAPIFVIEVPVQLKRCGMAVRLVVRPTGSPVDPEVDAGLVALIGKALDWFERLRSGRADSALAIAEQDQVRSAYVTKVMGLAYLAPDILRRLVRGDHPRELSADRLMKMLPLPMDWEEQRVVLKMSG